MQTTIHQNQSRRHAEDAGDPRTDPKPRQAEQEPKPTTPEASQKPGGHNQTRQHNKQRTKPDANRSHTRPSRGPQPDQSQSPRPRPLVTGGIWFASGGSSTQNQSPRPRPLVTSASRPAAPRRRTPELEPATSPYGDRPRFSEHATTRPTPASRANNLTITHD